LHTTGYAHPDTKWNLEYPVTINEYIKNSMEYNFKLLKKYPDYVFNFTGLGCSNIIASITLLTNYIIKFNA